MRLTFVTMNAERIQIIQPRVAESARLPWAAVDYPSPILIYPERVKSLHVSYNLLLTWRKSSLIPEL